MSMGVPADATITSLHTAAKDTLAWLYVHRVRNKMLITLAASKGS